MYQLCCQKYLALGRRRGRLRKGGVFPSQSWLVPQMIHLFGRWGPRQRRECQSWGEMEMGSVLVGRRTRKRVVLALERGMVVALAVMVDEGEVMVVVVVVDLSVVVVAELAEREVGEGKVRVGYGRRHAKVFASCLMEGGICGPTSCLLRGRASAYSVPRWTDRVAATLVAAFRERPCHCEYMCAGCKSGADDWTPLYVIHSFEACKMEHRAWKAGRGDDYLNTDEGLVLDSLGAVQGEVEGALRGSSLSRNEPMVWCGRGSSVSRTRCDVERGVSVGVVRRWCGGLRCVKSSARAGLVVRGWR